MAKLISSSAIIGALLAFGSATPALAGTAVRAWVSGHGTDAPGCGAPTAPCRSLQYTHDNVVAAGGEIDVLDPAGYGAITIAKSISIINDGVGTAGVQATSGNAITVSAGPSDTVLLRGLSIEGVGGQFGIYLFSGGRLVVEDSAISNFDFSGIQYEPPAAAYLQISNTRIANNVHVGVNVHPLITSGGGTVNVVVERSEATNDADGGVYVDGRGSDGSVKINATVADSLLSDSTQAGVYVNAPAGTAPAYTMVRNCVLTYSQYGVAAVGANATLDVGHSTLDGDGTAFAALSSGVVGSYGDNNVNDNGGLGAPVALSLH
jgi:hypothetical protein